MVMAISAGLGYFVAISSRAMRGIEGWRNRVLWLSSPEATNVVLTGLALGLMGFSLVLTASRSGLVCFVASMLVVSLALMNPRVHSGMRRRRMALVGYIACLALATVVWTGFPLIANRFTYSATATPYALGGRAGLWSTAIEIARRFPVTGTGLNTYTHVKPFFQTSDPPNSDEAHNDYLQLAAEGGLLVGIPVFVLAILFVREVRLRFRNGHRNLLSYWLRVGAVAGLVAIAVQESVEFSLQLPGNGVMFAALCAIAVHKSEEI
jgi:O-antigen ligase